VNLSTAAEFLEAGAVALGVGGELVQADALKDDKRDVIVENARQFLAVVKQTRAQIASQHATAKSTHTK
jgi:2-dehydro-3-deoxyphosphogluconate aldolase/(4S)-4-hydroxy-2-oxoglutarate aldolase